MSSKPMKVSLLLFVGNHAMLVRKVSSESSNHVQSFVLIVQECLNIDHGAKRKYIVYRSLVSTIIALLDIIIGHVNLMIFNTLL